MKKNIENSTEDGIYWDATTGIFFVLRTANIKPRKASQDAIGIIKLASGICGGNW